MIEKINLNCTVRVYLFTNFTIHCKGLIFERQILGLKYRRLANPGGEALNQNWVRGRAIRQGHLRLTSP